MNVVYGDAASGCAFAPLPVLGKHADVLFLDIEGEHVNANTGKVYESMEDALAAGEDIRDLVQVTGSRENVNKVATAVRKAKRKAQRQARRKNR